MSRFVKPEPVTLRLANGDTLTVKRRLNAGEQHDVFTRVYVTGADGTLRINPLEIGFAEVVAYLLDWSLTGDDGHKVAIADRPAADVLAQLKALDPDDFAEIRTAIQTHVAATRAARDAEKKTAGPTGSAPTSPSPAAAAGPTLTSLH